MQGCEGSSGSCGRPWEICAPRKADLRSLATCHRQPACESKRLGVELQGWSEKEGTQETGQGRGLGASATEELPGQSTCSLPWEEGVGHKVICSQELLATGRFFHSSCECTQLPGSQQSSLLPPMDMLLDRWVPQLPLLIVAVD